MRFLQACLFVFTCLASPIINSQENEGTLQQAISNNNIELVKELIKNESLRSSSLVLNNGEHAINYAAYLGNKEVVELLLESGTDINIKNAKGFNPLLMALYNGHVNLAKYLIMKGAMISNSTGEGVSALDFAATLGDKELIQQLSILELTRESEQLDKSGKANENSPNFFFKASELGRIDLLERYLSEGQDINTSDDDGWTALLFATAANQSETIKYLMDKGADVNQKTIYGYTALIISVLNNDVETAKFLIRKGANKTVKTIDGLSAFSVAQAKNNEIIQELLTIDVEDINNIKLIQQLLVYHGYDVGTPDGVVGRKTKSGILNFQTDRNLRATGEVDLDTFTTLNSYKPLLIEVEKPFNRIEIGKFEVTNGEYFRFLRETNYSSKTIPEECDWGDDITLRNDYFISHASKPITCVTKDDVNKYIDWLNDKTGMHFELPKVNDWIYSANPKNTRYYWGDSIDDACEYANVLDQSYSDKFKVNEEELSEFVQCKDNNAELSKRGVYKPNSYGLYDMIGNAHEFCITTYEIKRCGGAYATYRSSYGGALDLSNNADGKLGFRLFRYLD